MYAPVEETQASERERERETSPKNNAVRARESPEFMSACFIVRFFHFRRRKE